MKAQGRKKPGTTTHGNNYLKTMLTEFAKR
jgi:hypothetical protein